MRWSIDPPLSSRSGRSTRALMRSGSAEAGSANMADTPNAQVVPSVSMMSANMSGAAIAPIWKVAVLEVTACIRCDLGTMFAVMAERAGPPSTLVTPSIAVTAYTCQGSRLSNMSSKVISPMKTKLKDWVTAISFFLSHWSASAPPNRIAGS